MDIVKIYVDDNDIYETEYQVYTFDELLKMNPEDDEIKNFIIEENNKFRTSIEFSIVVEMWRFCGYKQDAQEIIDFCRENRRWFYEHTWTKEQRAEFEVMLEDVYMKWFNASRKEARRAIVARSAFGNSFNLDDLSEENYEAYMKLVNKLRKDADSSK